MSLYAFIGALETGLAFALVALGAYLTFRVLDFPDLTVEGSFPLGAAVCAKLMVSGVDPWTATLVASLAGCVAGFATAFLNLKLRILHILAGILTAIAGFLTGATNPHTAVMLALGSAVSILLPEKKP